MKRSTFISTSFAVVGGSILSPKLLAQPMQPEKTVKLTLLHTNDTHSHIDPFPANHRKYAGQGGVVQRQRLIEQIRQEEEHVLLVDAGDIFQGTPYFNMYHGVLEMKVMSELQYDVATMGNHDFDIGIEGFVRAQAFADFPFVTANYDFDKTLLKGRTKEEVIIRKGKLKIGVFGIGVELTGLVPDSKYGETIYLDPIKTANERALSLKQQGCDLVICLSHLGYSYTSTKVSDLQLAKATSNIHVIIGGHTHTFLDKPTEVENSIGETVLVNQVGYAGINVGRIDFEFHRSMKSNASVLTVI